MEMGNHRVGLFEWRKFGSNEVRTWKSNDGSSMGQSCRILGKVLAFLCGMCIQQLLQEGSKLWSDWHTTIKGSHCYDFAFIKPVCSCRPNKIDYFLIGLYNGKKQFGHPLGKNLKGPTKGGNYMEGVSEKKK